MKVAHVIARLCRGGAEVMLRRFVEQEAAQGHETVVIALSPVLPSNDENLDQTRSLPYELTKLGVEVITLDVNGFSAFAEMRKLARVVNDSQAEIVQSWMYTSNLFTSYASALFKMRAPIVWSVHHSLYAIRDESLQTQMMIRFSRRSSRMPCRTVYVSATSATQHLDFGFAEENHVVIPNGYDTRLFQKDGKAAESVRKELGINSAAIVISSIGRIHPMKDHDTLLSAAEIYVKSNPDAIFLIVGAASEAAQCGLKQKIQKSGLLKNVLMLGERSDISRIINASDIVTSSSSYGEAFPIVIGEAMACEVPCVATDIGDSSVLVGDAGRIAPPKDPVALANAWEELFELESEGRASLGREARRRIVEHYSIESVVQKYHDLYGEVLKC